MGSNMVTNYKEKDLMRYFDLDKRFLATRDIGLEKKKGTTWKIWLINQIKAIYLKLNIIIREIKKKYGLLPIN